MGMSWCLLLYFYRNASRCRTPTCLEGIQRPKPPGSQWGVVVVSFLLTAIYLPLSTMALHVLVWSDDLWVVPNPYLNATTFPPELPPLGPSSQFRDPLDFCYTTTMRKDAVNYAPIVVIVAFLVFVGVRFFVSLCVQVLTPARRSVNDILPSSPATLDTRFCAKGGCIYRIRQASELRRHGSRIPKASRP